MKDINYKGWADYIVKLFKRHGISPSLVLDLGCGTGSFCNEMALRGYDMIGIDISAEMLSVALEKAEKSKKEILFINQDMCEFELYGTVGAVVSLLDSMNYITNKRDMAKLFKLVHNYIDPGGLFIFDINTAYKLKNSLGSNVFYSIDEEVSYIWQNSYDTKRNICEFDLTFFVKENVGNNYVRYDELHEERAYNIEELTYIAEKANLSVEGIYHEFTFSKYKENSERIFFVCKK